MTTSTRPFAFATAAACLRLALVWPLLGRGIYAISDDDFARVTIAQRFWAHPAFDPSGTSWLPAQFWLLGAAAKAFGRSWELLRGASVALGMLAAAFVAYELAIYAPKGRAAALTTALVLLGSWSVWTGACTVPEGYTGLLTGGALVALSRSRYPWHAAALVVLAALSRYEVWAALPVIAFFGWLWKRGPWALAPLCAPLVWIAWNQYAHGDALHFLARVAKYRAVHAHEAASAGLHFPAVAAGGSLLLLVAVAVAAAANARSFAGRSLHQPLLLGAFCTVLFLAYGDARGGAPTHHPERALIGVWACIAMAASMGAQQLWHSDRRLLRDLGAAALGLCIAHGGHQAWRLCTMRPPGEARAAQFELGRALASEPELLLRPCAYEHYALAAGYGAPERVRLLDLQARDDGHCPEIVKGSQGDGIPLR